MALDSRFCLDPAYGRGIYRRRIELVGSDREVTATVLDDYHDMRCILRHEGGVVQLISGRIDRAPFTTCAAAPAALQELVGVPLTASHGEIYGAGRAKRNCTHLFDIAALAIGAARDGVRSRSFDFVVPDETEYGMLVDAWIDHRLIHRWMLHDEEIVSPIDFAGRSLFGGFAAWASATFGGAVLDAALHLQKVVFVARGRRYLLGADDAGSIRDEPERLGACYTFSEPRFSIATNVPGYIRDFTIGFPGHP